MDISKNERYSTSEHIAGYENVTLTSTVDLLAKLSVSSDGQLWQAFPGAVDIFLVAATPQALSAEVLKYAFVRLQVKPSDSLRTVTVTKSNNYGTWSSTVAYKEGNIVSYMGLAYQATADNTNSAPALLTNWARFTTAGALPNFYSCVKYGASDALTFATVDIPAAINLDPSRSSGITAQATLSKTVSAFADYDATVSGAVKVTTTAAHGLTTGDTVIIDGTTNYNGVFTVEVIDATNFYIVDTWVADDATGTVVRPEAAVIPLTGAGHYLVSYSVTLDPAAADKSFALGLYQNATLLAKATAHFHDTEPQHLIGSTWLYSVAGGDRVWLGAIPVTDTTGATAIEHSLVLVQQ